MAGSTNHLRYLASLATKATERALSLDEQGRPREAERSYERAALVLRRALNVHIKFLSTRERPQIIALLTKMEKYLGMVQDRLAAMRHGMKSGGGYYISGRGKGEGKKDEWENEMERRIEMDILDRSPGVRWDDVSGLEGVKAALKEMVVLPAKRPDLYQGLRAPSRGMLLFGPSGTGKSLVAKAVASESEATFFSISASSLASKYHGESEQLMKALFEVAKRKQPSFIFIDEIDSILGKRGGGDEHEASRRLKTEFLCMFDGATTRGDERIFIMGATNRPQDLDEAVRRRLVKRFYVPLPDAKTRFDMMRKLRDKPGVRWDVTDEEMMEIAKDLKWFSGSDMNALCREAALMPLRDLGADVHRVATASVRPVLVEDLMRAKELIRPNVSKKQLVELEAWTKAFGTRTPGILLPPRASSLPPARRRRSSSSSSSSGNQKTVAEAARTHTRTRSADTEYSTRRNRRISPPTSSRPRAASRGSKPPIPVPQKGATLRRQLSGITERRGGRGGEGVVGRLPRTSRRYYFE